MLSFIEEGRLYLEDPEDNIRLDISSIGTLVPALYTETSMVVVGGRPDGDCFLVDFISPPPLESRQKSTEALSCPNYLINSPMSDSVSRFKVAEKEYTDMAIVLISDVWLDCSRTMAKLEKLFQGFEGATVPSAFIMMGPFISNLNCGSTALNSLTRAFEALCDMIRRYPVISSRSKFIFVPSLDDPLAPKILPRPPLLPDLLKPFHQHSIDCQFTSNPTRLYVFSKEIILFRRDYTILSRKNQLEELSSDSEATCSAFRTILEQAHLSSFQLGIQPRAWEYDHSLCVYPSPDYLVVAERSRPLMSKETDGCFGINPGSFATFEFSFALLYPLLGKLEAWYFENELLLISLSKV